MLPYLIFVAALCSVANGITCPTGYVDIDSKCFSFRRELLVSWAYAKDFCGNSTVPSTLAMPKSPDTHRALVEYIFSFGLEGSYWLGGNDLNFEGDWHWDDKTRVDRGTPFWAIASGLLGWSQEPEGGTSENCLLLDESRRYYFNDVNCDDGHHPLCQMI